MIEIDLNEDAARKFGVEAGATKKQIELAMQRAIKNSGSEIRALIVRDIAKSKKIPPSAVSKRTRVPREDRGSKIWIGFDPLSLSNLNPRQTRKGVTARGATTQSAFIIRKIGNKTHPVWVRPGVSVPSGIVGDEKPIGPRGPLLKLFLDIKSAQSLAEKKFTEIAPAIFMKNFERELDKLTR